MITQVTPNFIVKCEHGIVHSQCKCPTPPLGGTKTEVIIKCDKSEQHNS